MLTQGTEHRSVEAAKDVICELIAASGGVLRGKLRLNKAFYFAHLFYWQEADDVLTSYPVVRLPNGPAVDNLDQLLTELVQVGRIEIKQTPNGPYVENVYHIVDDVDAADRHSARVRAIRQAVDLVEGRTAAELSEMTHEHSWSWQNTANGRELNIYLDVLSDEQRAEIVRGIEEMRAGK
jgi:Protein of unknown function (DUF4065)